jgi:2-iminobutanoate/2-iminopropanoate deaminase
VSDREALMVADAPKPAGPYSHAVRSGGLLFCSGQVPTDPATGALVEGSIGDQARQCLENLSTVCAGAGVSLGDAVRMAIYVTDISTFAQVNEVYATFFDADPPARTTIGVAALPGGAQIEMDAIVAAGD